MSNGQHMFVRFIAVAVLVALHWFPHTHAANQPSADAEPVGVATIP